MLALTCALGSLGLQSTARRLHASQSSYEDNYYLPPPAWLRTLSLGYREGLADLIWIRALIYFGDEVMHRGAVRHIPLYGRALVELDPYFKHVYHWVAMTLLYNSGQTDEAEAQQAVRFLERGLRRFPADGELAWDLGATLAYELAPLQKDPAQHAATKARSVDFLLLAARQGAGPPWLIVANASSLEHLGRSEQAARHLEEMFVTTKDEDLRKEIALRLQRLRSESYAQAFRLANEAVERQRAQDFPYLPPSLHLLVGERLVEPLAATRPARP